MCGSTFSREGPLSLGVLGGLRDVLRSGPWPGARDEGPPAPRSLGEDPRAPGHPLRTDAPNLSPLQASSREDSLFSGLPLSPLNPVPHGISPTRSPLVLGPQGSAAHSLCHRLTSGDVLTSSVLHALGDMGQASWGLLRACLPSCR